MEKHYSTLIITQQSASTVFNLLKNIQYWWSGLFEETILGSSNEIGDFFEFTAGRGMHYSKQQLVVSEAPFEIAWKVTESRLLFLKNPGEWEGTIISFHITENPSATEIQFEHLGLNPQLECYQSCSSAWQQYMNLLRTKLSETINHK